jgi:acyl phosphate:glycerol-3-phosphate acyltransferase
MPELTTSVESLILIGIAAYLLGAVPFGILVTRALGLGDLRRIGSGNIGATNVLRTGNKGAAALTLFLDGAKGAVAVLIARWLAGEDAAQLAGLAAFLGHLYPVYLSFKGGKGVATFLGVLLGLDWRVGAAACAVWLVIAVVGRISSVAALVSAATTPIWFLLFDHGRMLILVFVMTVLIYIRHSANIARLKKGTEPRIGARSGGA